MKKLLLTTALAGFLAAPATGAQASWWWWDWFPEIDPESCTDLCDSERIDIKQSIHGLQEALNTIDDIDDATDVEQTAVNAANLVNLEGTYTEDVDFDHADGMGTVDQDAYYLSQVAANVLEGGWASGHYNVAQSATNVVNSVTGDSAWNIYQFAGAYQNASNYMSFGKDGYDADADVVFDSEGEVEVATQSAVNAANIVDIGELNNEIVQVSVGGQVASNVAVDVGGGYHWYHGNDVWDFAQTATNVANIATVGVFDLNKCACDWEVDQHAYADQSATNLLSGSGWTDIHNVVQSATNVANSVSLPSDE